MGRVRTKLIKRASRVIIEKYYPRLTLDFDSNKKVTEEVAVIPSKAVRNKIAGFITHLMKRIQRGGSVRGISLKLQEEERERRLDFLPERSAFDVESVEIDPDTADMLKSLDFESLAGVKVQTVAPPVNAPAGGQRGQTGQRGERREGGQQRERGGAAGGGTGGGGGGGGERRERGEKAGGGGRGKKEATATAS